MSILILHRNPLEPFPYGRWLADYDGDVVVLAARNMMELFGEEVPTSDLGYARLALLDNFDDEELVLKTALELAAEYRVRRVIAHHEGDVLTAALLRERLGLPGPRFADLLPFRDKALMKARARQAGVAVAAHIVPRAAAEARDFAERNGFPLVFKDRAGYGSIGLEILNDSVGLERYLAQRFTRRGPPARDLLLERYIPGRICHVDGLVVTGQTVLAWPSQLQYAQSSYRTDVGPRVDLTLDPDDPLTGRLLKLTDQALAALQGGGLRDYAFHAEIFHTADDELVLCEVAARPGGAKVRDVLHSLFGFNLAEYATRAQADLPLPALQEALRTGERPRPRRMAGQLVMMKRPGLVRGVPVVPTDPWVDRCWIYARPGQVLQPPTACFDFLLAAVGWAPTRQECERRLRGLGARFEAQIDIVTPVTAERG